MATSGIDLIQKWISKHQEMGLLNEDLQMTSFVYGDTIYSVQPDDSGQYDIQTQVGKVVIFRDLKELSDDYTCRVCGSEYNNKLDTIRCCMNDDE